MELGLSPDQTHPDFTEMLEQGVMAESSGFAALWVHEHHSAAMMYPDPLMALAALAPVTQSIKLGTSMLLLPIHHPVRMAQSTAMLDVLSGGRVLLGISNGYSATDLAAFGVTGKHRGRRLQQGLELARQLWSGKPVTAIGDGFELNDFVMFPPTVQHGGPPIYLGGHADAAIKRAATHGDGYFLSATAGLPQLKPLIETYQSYLKSVRRPFEGVWLNRVTCVVENTKQKELARTFFAKALIALYASWGHSNVTSLSERQRSIDDICRNNLIVGEADECLEQIAQYQSLGVTHIACLTSFGGPPTEVSRRSINLLGKHVIPKLSKGSVETADSPG
ncbi:MAG: LLM class flavin-dependent oxidoreductase [Halieaceae bacterium]|nr:LLM class flavin-dependent oxidoreductase [Halieaceae bacterium]